MPDETPPPRKTYGLKPKEFERVNAPPGSGVPSADHDILSIQRGIREREIAAGFDNLKPVAPKRSGRRRDYFLLLLGGNVLGGAVAAFGHESVIVLVSAVAGMVIFTVGLTWIMWFLIDDY